MKTILALLTLGSAAAFAPQSVGSRTAGVARKATADLEGMPGISLEAGGKVVSLDVRSNSSSRSRNRLGPRCDNHGRTKMTKNCLSSVLDEAVENIAHSRLERTSALLLRRLIAFSSSFAFGLLAS